MKTYKFTIVRTIKAESKKEAEEKFDSKSDHFLAVSSEIEEIKDKKYVIGLERREKGWVEVVAKNKEEAIEKGYDKESEGQVNWGKEETEFEDPEEVERFEHEIKPDLPKDLKI